jgi:hypothetical protein
VSTAIFIASTLPMLVKAGRTKNLASYSLGNILLANIGNLIYAVYVFSLPLGPVWALHGFHLCATGLMLFWYVRHAGQHRRPARAYMDRPDGIYGSTTEPRSSSASGGEIECQCVPDNPIINPSIAWLRVPWRQDVS